MIFAGELRRAIDRCFIHNEVPDIVLSLKAESGQTKSWAEKTLKTICARSPTSLYVTLRLMRLGRCWSIKQTFEWEHQIAGKFMRHPDFTEGVSALLIKKPAVKPTWQPASLDEVRPEHNIADDFFQKPTANLINTLNQDDYKVQPYVQYSLPSEKDVETLVRAGGKSQKAIVDYFVELRRGKQGIRQVVQEIVDRKTRVEGGTVCWIHNESVLRERLPCSI
jgi:3-hydroxyisobutyryl-CoA hydrolase